MSVPTLSDVQTFFASDIILNTINPTRITYWINDIVAKGICDEGDFGKLYFNAFMNLMGHFLLVYETNTVSYRGGVSSETTAKVSRTYVVPKTQSQMENEYSMTKYGQIFLSLMSRLSIANGGFVAVGGSYV